MTSQLNVDTIVDKAGSGGTNVKIGNTSTCVSQGGAVTSNLATAMIKAWLSGGNGAEVSKGFIVALPPAPTVVDVLPILTFVPPDPALSTMVSTFN